MKLILSFDDYCEENWRLAKLLEKYNLEKYTIWFIDLRNHLAEMMIEEFNKLKFEIGSHTFNHPYDLKLLLDRDLYYEIVESRKYLQMEQYINWFCYPKGRYNERVKNKVKEAGYEFARTTKILGIKWDDPLEQGTTIHIYPRKEYQGRYWLELAKKWFEKAKKENGTFHLWGHAWEIDKLKEWKSTEKFFKFLRVFFTKYESCYFGMEKNKKHLRKR